MGGKPNVSETCYRYDGSFCGFLSAVFESFARREIPFGVYGPEEGQVTLFGGREIASDTVRAQRVIKGLHRLGGMVWEWVTTIFCAATPGKDTILLRFVHCAFAYGAEAVHMLGNGDVAAAFSLYRAVRNEVCHFIEFIRFEEREGVLGAMIHPRHRVLRMLNEHFVSRLPDETFLIYDATHHEALLRSPQGVEYRPMERYLPRSEDAEETWQSLWKCFYRATTIEERRNLRAQRTHLPKRFWADLCELQPDPPLRPERPGTDPATTAANGTAGLLQASRAGAT